MERRGFLKGIVGGLAALFVKATPDRPADVRHDGRPGTTYDTVPIVLQPGERVLNRAQQRALDVTHFGATERRYIYVSDELLRDSSVSLEAWVKGRRA